MVLVKYQCCRGSSPREKLFLCSPFMFLHVGVFVLALAMQNEDALKVQLLINNTFYNPLFVLWSLFILLGSKYQC